MTNCSFLKRTRRIDSPASTAIDEASIILLEARGGTVILRRKKKIKYTRSFGKTEKNARKIKQISTTSSFLLPTFLLTLFLLFLLLRLLLHAERPADPAVEVVITRRVGPPRVPRFFQRARPEGEAAKVSGAASVGAEAGGRRGGFVGLFGVDVGDLREALAAAVFFVGAEDPAFGVGTER